MQVGNHDVQMPHVLSEEEEEEQIPGAVKHVEKIRSRTPPSWFQAEAQIAGHMIERDADGVHYFLFPTGIHRTMATEVAERHREYLDDHLRKLGNLPDHIMIKKLEAALRTIRFHEDKSLNDRKRQLERERYHRRRNRQFQLKSVAREAPVVVNRKDATPEPSPSSPTFPDPWLDALLTSEGAQGSLLQVPQSSSFQQNTDDQPISLTPHHSLASFREKKRKHATTPAQNLHLAQGWHDQSQASPATSSHFGVYHQDAHTNESVERGSKGLAGPRQGTHEPGSSPPKTFEAGQVNIEHEGRIEGGMTSEAADILRALSHPASVEQQAQAEKVMGEPSQPLENLPQGRQRRTAAPIKFRKSRKHPELSASKQRALFEEAKSKESVATTDINGTRYYVTAENNVFTLPVELAERKADRIETFLDNYQNSFNIDTRSHNFKQAIYKLLRRARAKQLALTQQQCTSGAVGPCSTSQKTTPPHWEGFHQQLVHDSTGASQSHSQFDPSLTQTESQTTGTNVDQPRKKAKYDSDRESKALPTAIRTFKLTDEEAAHLSPVELMMFQQPWRHLCDPKHRHRESLARAFIEARKGTELHLVSLWLCGASIRCSKSLVELTTIAF